MFSSDSGSIIYREVLIGLQFLFDLSQKCFITVYLYLVPYHSPLQTIVALTFAHYAAKPFFEDCDPPQNAVKLLAACCLCK